MDTILVLNGRDSKDQLDANLNLPTLLEGGLVPSTEIWQSTEQVSVRVGSYRYVVELKDTADIE